MIYKLKRVAPKSVIKMVYYSIVDSHIRYGITSFGSARSSALDRLNAIHTKIIKYMKDSHESTTQALSNLGILNIPNLYKFELIKLVFNIRNGVAPKVFKTFINTINHSHGTRSRNLGNYNVPQPNTERDKTSIKYQCATCWNSLPSELKSCNIKTKFLESLKKHLLDSQLESH